MLSYKDFNVGDRVIVDHLVIGRLTDKPGPHPRIVAGTKGVVVEKRPTTWHDGSAKGYELHVRFPHVDDFPLTWHFCDREGRYARVSLWAKGDGTAIAGKHYWLSPSELREQRYEAFVAKVQEHNHEHQGFVNPATWMAHLYLTNDRTAMSRIPGLIRKDGTINPKRLQKLFVECRLKLDDWVFECPIDVPTEFKHYSIRGLHEKRAVNWGEIAAEFAQSHREQA